MAHKAEDTTHDQSLKKHERSSEKGKSLKSSVGSTAKHKWHNAKKEVRLASKKKDRKDDVTLASDSEVSDPGNAKERKVTRATLKVAQKHEKDIHQSPNKRKR